LEQRRNAFAIRLNLALFQGLVDGGQPHVHHVQTEAEKTSEGNRMAIVPVAQAMYLCDYHVDYDNGKVDLYGLFNGIRPENEYPYERGRFCVFAQLVNGMGSVPFFIDIRFAATNELIHTTETRHLLFPNRNTVVRLAMKIEGCRFQSPGLYLLEQFCDNTWVCDARLVLR
jgi:hypothetical protein